jgi:virulence factor Mce-like protein
VSLANSVRRRFEFVPGQHRPHPVRNGIIFMALLAFLLYIGYTRDVPLLNEGGQEVTAQFESAVGVISRTDVRVNGVSVGQVEDVKRHPSGEGAQITMKIKDGKGVTVKEDARAGIYWRTLLGGNFYIELQPGSPSADDIDAEIPLSRTTTQIEFDQLLTSFNPNARKGIQTFIREFDDGFDEAGPPARTLDRLGPAMEQVADGLPALRGSQPGSDIPELARGASRTLGALARKESDLAGLIEHAETSIAVTAARRQDIGTTLRDAPETMDDTRATLARVRVTLDELDPIADDLRPGLRDLDETLAAARPTMRTLRAFVPDATPFLRDIDPAVRSVSAAAYDGVPLMQRLNPTLDRTRNEINPFLDKRDDETNLKNSWAIGPFFGAVGSSGAGPYDINGHVQNFATVNAFGNEIASQDCARFGANAAACRTLTTTLGKLLGAGPNAGSVPVPGAEVLP